MVPYTQQVHRLFRRLCTIGTVPVVHVCDGLSIVCYRGEVNRKGIPVG